MNNLEISRKLDLILPRVEKPARYIGGELHSIVKEPAPDTVRFAFCFPDSYEIGMSYMGLQILYHILNKEDHIYCERCFAPAPDMAEEMRREGVPLFTLETKTALGDMDMVGFTLQYELSYTNILYMLELSGIPFKTSERGEDFPLICGGGPCVYNAEPVADLFDLFVIGDGEEVNLELCSLLAERKREGFTRAEFLRRAAKIQGIYVPSFYQPLYDANGVYSGYEKLEKSAPDKVLRAFLKDLNTVDFPRRTLVPLIEVVHDRSVCEIFRGCSRGCRFCQAGMVYRPVRERGADRILEISKEQLETSGNSELSVLSLSTSDYSDFERIATELLAYCKPRNIGLSLPSLRLDNFSFKVLEEIQGVRKTGLTFAPEAGTQRLRDVINKNITEDDIFRALDKAIDLGWNSVKLYFMMGLPTETDKDLDGIPDLASRIMELAASKNGGRRGRFTVSVSVANFVPKPDTPFQWVPQNTPEEFERKHYYLKEKFSKIKGVTYKYHGSYTSMLEAVFARGGRELCDVLISAYRKGASFDAWSESFNEKAWKDALEEYGIGPDHSSLAGFAKGQPMPWDIVDCGVSKEYLLSEYNKARQEKTTPDCRLGCNGCGVNAYCECRQEGALLK